MHTAYYKEYSHILEREMEFTLYMDIMENLV